MDTSKASTTRALAANPYQHLVQVGIELAAERDPDSLMEHALLEALALARADGGTLFLRTPDNRLKYAVMRMKPQKLALGGTTARPIGFAPLRMYDDAGNAHTRSIATHAALIGETIAIDDAYAETRYDFSGIKASDQRNNYRSTSFVAVPLKDRKQDVIGVIQLVNARDDAGKAIPFGPDLAALIEALGAQTAVALENLLVFQRMISTGLALSAERDHNRLMETILLEAKAICNADGGTLYLRTDDNRLKFEIMRTDSLKIAMGGTTGKAITFPPLPMYREEEEKDAEGKPVLDEAGNPKKISNPNHKNIASHAALTGETVNIPDAYEAVDFDFSGTKKFDEGTGYRSKSFLTVPLKNHQGDVIGVLQLLNAQDRTTNEVIPFSGEVQPLVEALASQAAVALDNQRLMEAQKKLFEAFIALIATAIDAKSPYTGGHCQRVPELSMMLARAANAATEGPFADFSLNHDQMYELQIASLLHDCGKVTTPEYVVDKATKLETIYNRIHEVRTRFEVVKRDAVIDYLRGLIDGKDDPDDLRARLEERLTALDDDFAFVAESNVGGEFMAPEKIERLKRIATVKWTRTLDDRIGLSQAELERVQGFEAPELPVEENLLSDKPEQIIKRTSGIKADWGKFGFNMKMPENAFNLGEVYNLSIARGTLTEEERFKINDHIVQTIIMLETLPFPKHLRRVAEYAGGHHEMMNGKGYPRGLTGDKMSPPARMMAIADIFEALTATDRPYKPPKKLSEAIKIMSFMKKDGHVDPDLFALFLKSGVYKEYADRFLRPDQVDEVNVDQYLNPPPPPPPPADGAKKAG